MPNVGDKPASRIPDKCPHCHEGIQAIERIAFPGKAQEYWAIYQCPLADCNCSFTAQYIWHGISNRFELHHVEGGSLNVALNVPETVENTSPDFLIIYQQALMAEKLNLSQLVGPGLRKALEFLIKDYAKLQNSEANVEKAFLGNVIDNHIEDSLIKSTAKRAVWLGNDETHYVRKWTDHDIGDMKRLIRITINSIESNLLAQEYEESMPDSGPTPE